MTDLNESQREDMEKIEQGRDIIQTVERKYLIHDGEVTLILPAGYGEKSIDDLIKYLAADRAIIIRKYRGLE